MIIESVVLFCDRHRENIYSAILPGLMKNDELIKSFYTKAMTNISVTLKVVVDCSERRRKTSAPAVTRRKVIGRMTVRLAPAVTRRKDIGRMTVRLAPAVTRRKVIGRMTVRLAPAVTRRKNIGRMTVRLAPAVTRRKDIGRMTVRPIIFPAGKVCPSVTLQRA